MNEPMRAMVEADFVQLEDGFWYWWPKAGGAVGAHTLREIADLLDARNKEWADVIAADPRVGGAPPETEPTT